jgi:dienelactone hydrolase
MEDNRPPRFQKLKQLLSSLKRELDDLWGQLKPRRTLDWAIAAGMGVVALLAVIFEAREALSGLGQAVDIFLAFLAALIGFWLCLAVGIIGIRLIRLALETLSPLVIAAIVIALATQVWVWGDNYWINIWLAIAVVVTGLSFSIGMYLILHLRKEGGWLRTTAAVFILLIGVGGIGGISWLFVSPGETALDLPGELLLIETGLEAENPSDFGDYQVDTLTYGSGTDQRRPEYGTEVDLITESVNASAYVHFSGWQRKVREWYWGFGMDEVPLNARVWYPLGEGPFPLVLIVHGNHNMTDYSEPGYQYLAELLASRGFIVASVDENFFNGSLYGKASSENDARAWLLLRHLEVWRDWNDRQDSFFYRQVDLDRIALVGHSRGGEAVGLAAAFNRMSHYTENGKIIWNFEFAIRSVVAIAPVDQQFKPGGHPAPLTDINYLVIQGSHDGDVSSFKGIQQYERVSFSDPAGETFKAAVYIYRANHGQFNSTWGDQDRRGMLGALLNKAAFLTEEEQRRIAEVYISAFLEATLHDREEYLPLFKDYHLAGDWLPATNYITQYQDGGTVLAASFEEDADLTTASLPGGSTNAVAVSTWKERVLRFRNNNLKENHVVRVSWGGGSAYFSVSLPTGTASNWGVDEDDTLVFLLADERSPFSVSDLVDFRIMLVDENGQRASVLLSEIIQVSPQFPVRFTKLDTWNEEIFEDSFEVVYQSVRIPMVEFLANNQDFSPGLVGEIRFVFDQSSYGEISLDDIGFDLEVEQP